MADRTVAVRLVAMVDQFRAGMATAGTSVTALDQRVAASNRKTMASLTDLERQARKTERSMMSAFGSIRMNLVGIGVPLAVGMIVKSFLDFEQQMARVQAVSDKLGRSSMGMKMLRNAALEMGEAYGFSAVQVGQAQEELAKAGIRTDQILGGSLKASLTLAAAGTISLADAARHTAVIMTQFELKAHDSQRIVDQLSKAANATVSDVGAMATALSYAGQQAHSMGVPLEDAITTISLMNQAGIDADMAGTNFRGMLVALSSPSKMAAEEIDKLGIKIYNSSGQFIGMRDLAGELQQKLGGLGQEARNLAIGRIFGNAQVPGVITMMKQGAEGFERMALVIRKTASAEDTARDKLNSLTGDINKFTAAVDTAAIKTLATLEPALRETFQAATGLAKGFGDMGGAAQLAVAALIAQMVFARRARDGMGGLRSEMAKGLVISKEYGLAQRELNRMQNSSAFSVGNSARASAQVFRVEDLRAANAQLSGLGAALGQAMGTIGMTDSKLGKLGATGMAAGKAITAGLSGAMNFLGGPFGVALAGATVLFALNEARLAGIRNRANELKSGLTQLGLTYASTGELQGKQVEGMLRENEQLRILVNNADRYKVSIEDVAKSTLNQRDAQKRVISGMETYIKQLDDYRGSVAGLTDQEAKVAESRLGIKPNENWGWLGDNAARRHGAIDRIKLTKEQIKALKEQYKSETDVAEALEAIREADISRELRIMGVATEDATSAQRMMAQGLAVLNDEKAEAADKLKAMAANLSLVTDGYYTLTDAQAAFYDSGRALKDAFTEAGKDGKEKRLAPVIDAVTGQFDVTTEIGGKQHAAFADMAKKTAASVQAAYDKAYKATGANAELAGAIAVQEFRKQRDAAEATLRTLTGNAEMAKQLANNYYALPDAIAQAIGADGMDNVVEQINDLGITIRSLPDGRIVLVSDTEREADKLEALGGKVTALPNGQFRVEFANQAALTSALHTLVSPKSTSIHATTNAAKVDADLRAAARNRKAFISAFASTTEAERALASLTRTRQMILRVNMVTGAPRRGTVLEGVERWGSVHTFASGGVAKVARPGTLYQWAEPETGGEAFIPRRGNPARSKAILDTAAGWYGLKVEKMATGGIMAPLSDMLGRWDSGVQTQQGLNAAKAQKAADLKANRQAVDDAAFGRLSAIRGVQKAEAELARVRKDSKSTQEQIKDAEWDLVTARRGLASATRELGEAQTRLKGAPAGKPALSHFGRFSAAVALGVKNTNAFLWALTQLANRGHGQLAMNLLEMGGPEAEGIAQGALRASDAALRGTAANVATAANQAKTMANFPAMLAVRSALKSGQSYAGLVGSGQVTAEALNAALSMMTGELNKSAAGKAMLAAMGGANAMALKADMRTMDSGGWVMPGKTLINNATGKPERLLTYGAAKARPWENVSQRASSNSVQITVRGEGVLSGMIEATVDGRLTQVARAVRHGARG